MNFTRDQEIAKDRIMAWMDSPDEWMFYLGGFAGTGKTTLLHYLINSMEKQPICVAPTGKAASVLQKRLTMVVVTTIHKILYQPIIPDINELILLELKLREQPTSEDLKRAIQEEKDRLARLKIRFMDNPAIAVTEKDLIIVDEASMVSNRMLDDFGKLGCKVLFVGDPGQLPPVNDTGYFTYTKPDAMLSEIVRQAQDNPIIRWSMKVRNGDSIPQRIEDGAFTKMPQKGFEIAKFNEQDQILCGKNSMRHRLNRSMRKLKGIDPEQRMPIGGEKLICLKNRFKFNTWFVNGIQAISTSPSMVNDEGDWAMDMLYEGKPIDGLPFYSYPFEAHYNFNAQQEPWQMRSHLSEFDYAYAITVHKSQGSEWDKVALVDDGLFENDRSFRRKWLYTAITRAKESLLWLGD